MPCLSKAFQPSKKPRPRLCSYNPKLGACRRAPQPGKDLQESIQPPCHTAFCPRHPLSWSCKHAHASQGHTHTSSSTWIPHPENRMSPSPQAQPKGGDRPHSVLQADCRQCTQSLSITHTCKTMEWSPHLRRYCGHSHPHRHWGVGRQKHACTHMNTSRRSHVHIGTHRQRYRCPARPRDQDPPPCHHQQVERAGVSGHSPFSLSKVQSPSGFFSGGRPRPTTRLGQRQAGGGRGSLVSNPF